MQHPNRLNAPQASQTLPLSSILEERRSAPWAMTALAASILLSSFGTSAANVALPSLAVAFQASYALTQWVALAYLLSVTLLAVWAGRWGDRFGRRRVLLVGVAMFAVGSALCGAAPTLPSLIGARALQGAGAAAMMALGLASVGDVVAKDRAGRAVGLLGSMSALGTALGPSLGGILIERCGWRALFWIAAPLAACAWALAARSLPNAAPRPAAPRAEIEGRRAGRFAGFMAGLGPAWRQLGGLRVRLALALIVMAVMMATLVVGPFHLTLSFGLSPAAVGVAMAAGPVVTLLSSAPAGRLTDRWGAGRVALLGGIGVACAACALAASPMRFGVWGYVVPLCLLTASYGTFQTANTTAAMAAAGDDARGLVSGLLTLARNLGLMGGVVAFGGVFALASGISDVATATPEAAARGMRWSFACAGLLVAGAFWGAHRFFTRPSDPAVVDAGGS